MKIVGYQIMYQIVYQFDLKSNLYIMQDYLKCLTKNLIFFAFSRSYRDISKTLNLHKSFFSKRT